MNFSTNDTNWENHEKMRYQAENIRNVCSEIMIGASDQVPVEMRLDYEVLRQKWLEIQARIDAIRLEVFNGAFR